LHNKHKALFATDVDTCCKNFAAGLKSLHANRMSALLIDIEAAIAEGNDPPEVVFPTRQDGVVDDHGPDVETIDKEDVENEAKVDDFEATKDDEDFAETEVKELREAKGPEVEAQSSVTDVPQPAVLLDSSTGDAGDENDVHSHARSPFFSRSPRKDISDEAWNAAPDAPSMDLIDPSSQEYAFLNPPPTTRKKVINDRICGR
jgi:hypothetical protein